MHTMAFPKSLIFKWKDICHSQENFKKLKRRPRPGNFQGFYHLKNFLLFQWLYKLLWWNTWRRQCKGEEYILAHSFKATQSWWGRHEGRSIRLTGHTCGKMKRTVRGVGLQNHKIPPQRHISSSKSPASTAFPNSVTSWDSSEPVGDISHSNNNTS